MFDVTCQLLLVKCRGHGSLQALNEHILEFTLLCSLFYSVSIVSAIYLIGQTLLACQVTFAKTPHQANKKKKTRMIGVCQWQPI